MSEVHYNRPASQPYTVGKGHPVRVNCSIGINRPDALSRERRKFLQLLSSGQPPHMVMDLSTAISDMPLWQVLLEEFNGPVGIVPHYVLFHRYGYLPRNALVDHIEHLAQSGVSFVTIHATPGRELHDLARRTRPTPVTSRGGHLVLRDLLNRNRPENVYIQQLPEIFNIATRHGLVINLGTTFRAASCHTGFDAAALAELEANIQLARLARNAGVATVLEGPGHIRLDELAKYVKIASKANSPMMPLGPMITDSHPNVDHIVNAAGAAAMMHLTKGGIINAITRIEHAGGIPNASLLREALDASLAVAHAASITYDSSSRESEQQFSSARSLYQSCTAVNGDKAVNAGCSRCGDMCPLITVVETSKK